MIPPRRISGASRPLFGRAPLPLPTGSEAAEFDRRAIEELDVPGAVLMENAGRGAALLVDHLVPDRPVLVLVGSGNNGGDGMVLARTLQTIGRRVSIGVAGSRPDPEPLLHGHTIPMADWREVLSVEGSPVVVDALLGTGIRGAPRAPFDEVIERIRQLGARGCPVISLDVPSGVDADTGAVEGDAVDADVTVAFGAPKRGTVLHPGRAHAGRLIGIDIGFPPWTEGDAGAELIAPEWAGRVCPRRTLRSHKKTEGRLLLLGGAPGMSGALMIAARGALRAGVGYLRLAVPPEARPIFHARVPEAVLVDALDRDALVEATQDSDAFAVGPGLGQGVLVEAARHALAGRADESGVLLDADALQMLARDALPEFGRTPGRAGSDRVARHRRLLTPHPGEASALLDRPSSEIVDDPIGAARMIADRRDATVLLKGTPSVVAGAGGGRVRVSMSGSTEFARAGMGDLLTGVAGALLARGLSAVDAGALALHWTGRAADHLALGDSLLPTDLPEALPLAMTEEGPGRTDLPFAFVVLDLPPAH